MMNENILQWNVRGLKNNEEGLQRIIRYKQPMVIALQETHLLPGKKYHLRGFSCVSREIHPEPGGRAHGGVALYINEKFKYDKLTLHTEIQAIAIKIKTPLEMILCNIYLPDRRWHHTEIKRIIDQLPRPCLILGDFNSDNTMWGSETTDSRGDRIEDIIDEYGMVLLNNGNPTYISIYTGRFSAIDLSFACPSIAASLSWNTLNDEYNSDHVPIIIETTIRNTLYTPAIRYNLRKDDWKTFTSALNISDMSGDVERDVHILTENVKQAAEHSVPKTGGTPIRRKGVPWWTEECKAANKEKKRALKKLKRSLTVRLGSTLSERREQRNGIPQGSVLSVTLFAIVVNGIVDGIEPAMMISLYVDDAAIYGYGIDLEEVGRRVQTAIDKMVVNTERIGFSFSAEKTRAVHFGRLRREHNPPQLRMWNEALGYADRSRFLGMIFDEKLRWQPHIVNIEVQCKRVINLLRYLSNFMWGAEREELMTLFKTLLCQKFFYGCMAYGSARRTRLKKLDRIYMQGLRLVTGAFRTSPLDSIV
ncbi:uncharacterized protein LOC112128432 [Cimex lectularius]|uniref:Reverse transcriptase domain-containing protein n=1 Tax=Cimex lectularius TaxID=79782 RepID=A0A8I6SNF2_CIMLE|nr:uncharacterized protein LOC112128432 [Cimex lectularius]